MLMALPITPADLPALPARPPLVQLTPQGLFCEAGGFHIDPWMPVARAVITHAHGDHLRPGCAAYLCAAPGEALVRRRLPEGTSVESAPYSAAVVMDGVRVSFHPAGHILGSAQIRIEHAGEVWVVSGDYKRALDPSCDTFEPQRCHAFVTEATFALPVFQWDPEPDVITEVLDWWAQTRQEGRPAVLFAYALGKAQRLLAEIGRRTDRPVYVHGAVDELAELYRTAGVRLAATRRALEQPRGTSFAGELIVAPVTARGSLWMRRFMNHSSAFASGWMRVRGARRRRGYERGFALSDHADWEALRQTVADTGAAQVYVTHGYTRQFARWLAERGLDAHAWATRFEGETDQE
jgi:putative mRNA 3-end processing factor